MPNNDSKSFMLTRRSRTFLESRQLKVFLCHSKDDKLKVRKLYKRLVENNFDVWLDEIKIMPGQDWEVEIKRAVRNSDTVIVCLSNSSITKEGFVQKEIRFALDVADEKPEGTIFLIPVRLEVCNVPDRITRFQWVDLFQKTGYSKLNESLQLRMKDLNIRYNSDEVLAKATEDSIRIPILGSIMAGTPLPPELDVAIDPLHVVEVFRGLLPSRAGSMKLYALEVKGDNLIDAMINNGDVVVIKPETKPQSGEMVVASLPDFFGPTLRYIFEEKNRYRLQPTNPAIKPIYLSKDEPLEIKGKVVMVIRRVKSD